MEHSNSIQAQFDAAKSEVPVGWHWMLDIFAQEVKTRQEEWLLLNGKDRWAKSDKPFFEFTLAQSKQKFGAWRNYIFIERVDHGWDKFDKHSYDHKFLQLNSEIQGMVSLLEILGANT